MGTGDRLLFPLPIPICRQLHKPSKREDSQGIAVETGGACKKQGTRFSNDTVVKKEGLLIYPCAYRGEKGAEERWQAEGGGCPTSEQSSLLLFGVLKVGTFPTEQMDTILVAGL